jgi:hypothetical protein
MLNSKRILTKTKSFFDSKYKPTQYIKSIRNNNILNVNEKDKLFTQNEYIKNKKIISISPGGYKGVYLLGTCLYIKDNYNLDNYIFTGASAGAWNALMMCCKKDLKLLKNEIVDYSIQNSNTIFELEYMMKKRILSYYTTDDFDLKKLFIGVTSLQWYCIPKTIIFSDFESLEDAINCCIASSHIPLITGGFINKYHDILSFDGGFSAYPYLNISNSILHISPDLWNDKKILFNQFSDLNEFTTLFSKNKYNFTELYNKGYNDAAKNNVFLKYIFDIPLENQ